MYSTYRCLIHLCNVFFIYKLSAFFPDEPKWRPGLKNQFYGFISGTSNLTCEAIAEPPATFIWYDKEGQPIREGMILTEDSKSTLVVMRLHWAKKRKNSAIKKLHDSLKL